jgi:hypothetical protein
VLDAEPYRQARAVLDADAQPVLRRALELAAAVLADASGAAVAPVVTTAQIDEGEA